MLYAIQFQPCHTPSVDALDAFLDAHLQRCRPATNRRRARKQTHSEHDEITQMKPHG